MPSRALDTAARALARDARGTSHTFGSRLAAGNEQARRNTETSKEEWQRRFDVAKVEHQAAEQEGERRKDARGAYPKDVLRRMDKARREMDLARQFGGVS